MLQQQSLKRAIERRQDDGRTKTQNVSDLLLPSHLPLLPFSKTLRKTLIPSILKLSALHLLYWSGLLNCQYSIFWLFLAVSGVWFTEAGHDVGLRYTSSQWYAWNCCDVCLCGFCKATIFWLTRVQQRNSTPAFLCLINICSEDSNNSTTC